VTFNNNRIIKALIAAVISGTLAWAGWVSTNITKLGDRTGRLEQTISNIDGKLDVIIDWVKHGHSKN